MSDTEGRSVLWSNTDGQAMLVAPDGWLVRGVSDDGMLAVFAGPSTQLVRSSGGTIVAELDAGPFVHEAEFSPDGRFVVTNNNGLEFPSMRVWDVSNGILMGSIGDDSIGYRSEFTPEGSRLVVGGADGRINVFDFEKLIGGVGEREAIIHRIPAHDTFIIFVVVSPDGSTVFSRAWDEPVKLWHLDTGEKLGEFGTLDSDSTTPPAAAFHPTEPWLYATLGNDQIAIYTLDTDELMEIARSRLTRDFSEEECQLYLRRSCGEGT